MSRFSTPAAVALVLFLLPYTSVRASDSRGITSGRADSVTPAIHGEAHYAMRDGLRIYLWEKHKPGLDNSFAASGKVALLVHGGTWSGRPDFDLQIRDYSLM